MIPGTSVHEVDEKGNLYPYKPQLTKIQRYLHRTFITDLAVMKEFADGDDIALIHNGDLTHGNIYKTELVSTRLADQILIACANMEKAIEILGSNVKKIRLVHGTGSHTFKEGSAPILVCSYLQAKFSHLDISASAHYLLDVFGMSVDIAHKGPSAGKRKWLKGNQLRWYTNNAMIRDLENGDKPADVILRGHFHEFWHETVRRHNKRGSFKTESFLLPSYCGLDEYGRSATSSTNYIGNGMVALEVQPKSILPFYEDTVHLSDIRTKETLW